MNNITTYLPPLSTTTPQASVASPIAPGMPALGNLPTTTVAPTIAYADLRNDSRGNPMARGSAAQAQAAATAEAAGFSGMAGGPTPRGSIISFPSLFFAQLLGQGTDSGTQDMMLSYEELQNFSNVKYMPSNAAKPVEPGPMDAFYQNLRQGMNTVPTQQMVAVAQQAPTGNGSAPSITERRPANAVSAANDANPPRGTANRSILKATGNAAYGMALTRAEQIVRRAADEPVEAIEEE